MARSKEQNSAAVENEVCRCVDPLINAIDSKIKAIDQEIKRSEIQKDKDSVIENISEEGQEGQNNEEDEDEEIQRHLMLSNTDLSDSDSDNDADPENDDNSIVADIQRNLLQDQDLSSDSDSDEEEGTDDSNIREANDSNEDVDNCTYDKDEKNDDYYDDDCDYDMDEDEEIIDNIEEDAGAPGGPPPPGAPHYPGRLGADNIQKLENCISQMEEKGMQGDPRYSEARRLHQSLTSGLDGPGGYPSSGGPPGSTSGLSQSQLIQLKAQIMAYRMLAKQQPHPQQIFNAVQVRRQETPVPAIGLEAPPSSGPPPTTASSITVPGPQTSPTAALATSSAAGTTTTSSASSTGATTTTTLSQTQITGSKGIKRKIKHNKANGEEGYNQRPQKIINITALENEKELLLLEDKEEVDKPVEARMLSIKAQTQFTAPKSDHTLLTNSYDIWLNLPDIPFNVFMMSQSTTQIRILTQVSSSWRKRITKNILENPARKTDLRVRSERALGPGMLPSKEELTNAMWLGRPFLSLTFISLKFSFDFSISRHPRHYSCEEICILYQTGG